MEWCALPREGGVAITPKSRFTEVWPEVAVRLARTLRRRGVPVHLVEDIVQEAGARALEYRVPFTTADDLLRWANTVARRIAVDNYRKERRTAVSDVIDFADSVDVGRTVTARLELDAVRRMLPQLSASDRDALLMERESWPAPGTTEAKRFAMRRLRARQRLAAMVEAALALLGWLWLRIRRDRRLATGLSVAVPVTVVALLALTHPAASPPVTKRSPPPLGATAEGLREGGVLAATPSSEPPPAARAAPVIQPPTGTFEVPIPGIGGDGRIWGRPSTPEDPLACVDSLVLGEICFPALRQEPDPP